MMKRRAMLAGLAGLGLPGLSRAQAGWPARTVRFVVPFAPGGPVEVPTRFIAEHLSQSFGQSFIVEAKPGAGGALGIQHVVQQNDPHVLLSTTSSVAILPALMRNPSYDPMADLVPISLLTDAPMVVLTRPDHRIRDLAGMLAEARAKPGRVTYASSGVGTTTHLGGALLCAKAGIEMLHIPYRGAAQAVNALYAGDTDLMVTGTGEAMAHIREGRLRALCVTSATRSPLLPEVPAAAELVPGYAIAIWYAMFGPRAMPAETVQRINQAVAPLREGTPLAARAAAAGQTLLLDGPAPLAERLAREVPQWKELAVTANIRAE